MPEKKEHTDIPTIHFIVIVFFTIGTISILEMSLIRVSLNANVFIIILADFGFFLGVLTIYYVVYLGLMRIKNRSNSLEEPL
jgi:hypothetical protein